MLRSGEYLSCRLEVSAGRVGFISADAAALSALQHVIMVSKSRVMGSIFTTSLIYHRCNHVVLFNSIVGDCLPGERKNRRQRQPCYQWCRSVLSCHSGKPEGPRRAASAGAPSSPSPRETSTRSEVPQRKWRLPASTEMSTRLRARTLPPPQLQHDHPRHSPSLIRATHQVRAGGLIASRAWRGSAEWGGAGRVRAWRGSAANQWRLALSVPSLHRGVYRSSPSPVVRGRAWRDSTTGKEQIRTGGWGGEAPCRPVDSRVADSSMSNLKCSESLRRASEASALAMVPAEPQYPRQTRTHAAPVAHLHARDNPCLLFASVKSSGRKELQTGKEVGKWLCQHL